MFHGSAQTRSVVNGDSKAGSQVCLIVEAELVLAGLRTDERLLHNVAKPRGPTFQKLHTIQAKYINEACLECIRVLVLVQGQQSTKFWQSRVLLHKVRLVTAAVDSRCGKHAECIVQGTRGRCHGLGSN